jgi:uncharacterized protein (DUF58 family)
MAYCGRSGVSKIAYARLLAAALAYLVSGQGDAVGTVGYGQELRPYIPSRTGTSHLRGLLVALTRLETSAGAATAGSLGRAIDLLRRRGLLIIMSDLYDEETALERELKRAARIGHEIAVFHVLSRDEIEFPFSGDMEFEDLETRQSVVASPASMAAMYRQDMTDFLERWRSRCASYGIDYIRSVTDMPLDVTLRGYLLKRSGAAAQ